MSIFVEVFRTTFPKRLRFDPESQILYAQLYSLSRQAKHKKYIPKEDIQHILDRYVYLPGRPWLQLPIVRHVLFIRQINAARRLQGKPSWLYRRGVEEEYEQVQAWLGRQVTASASGSGLRKGAKKTAAQAKLSGMVEREKFDRELLASIHVATAYQRMARLGIITVMLLIALAAAALHTEYLVYLYVYYWKRWDREAIMAWFREVTERHTTAEVPDAYAALLPPPCFSHVDPSTGLTNYWVNMVELVSTTKNVTVIAIPCPQAGERAFFKDVGAVAQECDSILLEGINFSGIDKMIPALFLPLKENTFPALGVHHRFLDILRTNTEPPMLYPGGATIGWRAYIQQIVIPFELRCVFNPTQLSATRGEARIGWGRLRDLIDQEEANANGTGSGMHVVCVPWTVNQMVNMEASLIKYGFKVQRTFPMPWIDADWMGRHFCDFYGIRAS